MKKIDLVSPVVLFGLVLTVFAPSWSHEGGHDVTTEQAIARAARAVATIVDKQQTVEREKLDASWKQATISGGCRENAEHYLISFDNSDVGKTLYVLLSITGSYKRANFTGIFSDLTFSSYPLQDCQ